MTTKKVRNEEIPKVFIAPDGGWGWMVVIAAGFSNLSTFPVLQQFGLLFRDKFERLGISSSAMTTIINMNSAITNCIGLANGPIFRKFSFRQVSFVGASTVFIGLMITTLSNSFLMYLISFSILYGAGVGISASANALALNTYFKKRRRVATGLSWTTTGLGPIVMPHIITALFHLFGETGTVLILCGFALHAVACSLLLQPVELHAKTLHQLEIDNGTLLPPKENNEKNENIYFSLSAKTKNLSAFSSQYLYNEDDVHTPGYEIIDPATPMLSKANDGYFSSSRKSSAHNSQYNLALSKKASIVNLNENRSRKASIYLSESKKNSSSNLGLLAQESLKPKRVPNVRSQIPESEVEDCPTLKAPQDLREEEKAAVDTIDAKKIRSIADQAEKKFERNFSVLSFKLDDDVFGDDKKYIRDNHSNRSWRDEDRKYLSNNHSNKSLRSEMRKKSNNFNVENEILKQASLKLEQYLMDNNKDDSTNNLIDNKDENQNIDEELEEKLTFCQKVAMFFDFDLLRDFTYVNLMVGITIANFNELNFSILTPFILGDYGIPKPDVAAFMSLLAGIDIGVRFCIPFVAGKIGWENNTFFLFGVMTMATGRIVLAYNQSYITMTIVAVIIGFGKGLRTVFMALVIPSHVPLEKLPGATGIQLLTAGLFFLFMGPVVGWVKDTTSTAVTLHCLNITTYLTAISWGAEKWYRSRVCKDKLKSES